MCKNEMAVLELYAEHGVGERFFNDAFYFDGLFFCHGSSIMQRGKPRASLREYYVSARSLSSRAAREHGFGDIVGRFGAADSALAPPRDDCEPASTRRRVQRKTVDFSLELFEFVNSFSL
jgi:hypothetical protein